MERCSDVVVLSAGIGKRMRSKRTKLLHPIMGKPILEYLIDTTSFFKNRIFVVKEGCSEIYNLIGKRGKIVFQKDVLGTGNALLCAKPLLEDDFVVIPGDCPFISKRTIKRLISLHLKEKPDATILGFRKKDPTGYGRIISENGKIRIVEEKDATKAERRINLVNSSVYCFNKGLFDCLERLENKNKQGEYYLTDTISMLKKVSLLEIDDEMEVMGINTREELLIAEDFLRRRILRNLMEMGVTIKSLETTYIEGGVKIGKDTTIFPNTYIFGKTIIGEECTIGPSTWISNSKILDKTRVYFSFIENSIIEEECSIGPFSNVRPGSIIKERSHIGAFVEVKNSIIGEETKAGHLAYIGDSEVGKRVNVGAGVITCNFDGVKKHKTTIEDEAFIGSNTSLVAPLTIGKRAFIGAGSVITKDVPSSALALERTEQRIVPKWRRNNP